MHHIKTNKHKTKSKKNETNESNNLNVINKINEVFTCKYCGQNYKHKQSVTKHIKYSCINNKTEDLTELVRLMNNQIQTQSKQIDKLMGKLEINNYFNTNNIHNITLLSYNDTDVSHLTEEDYKKCIKKVCFCVMGLIEKVHFNPEKPENMNIYISNIKDKYLMVYQNGKWNLKNKNELERLYDDKEEMIEQWIEENKDPEMEKFFKKYLDLKKDDKTMLMINEEIKLMMFNNKNLIE
jgi:hypothetical protein